VQARRIAGERLAKIDAKLQDVALMRDVLRTLIRPTALAVVIRFSVMARTIRLLLIALLVLATPLRALAATSMGLCAEGHNGRTTLGAAASADGEAVAHAHGSADLAVHEHANRGHSNHDHSHHADPQNQAHADTGSDDGKKSTCACGACCLGASALPPATVLPSIESTSSPIHFIPAAFHAVVLESAERPPLVLVL
jgi:hypothetical protein